LGGEVGVACGGKRDRRAAEATDHVLEFYLCGPIADRADIRHVVGDRRQALFERDLGGQRNIDSRLHSGCYLLMSAMASNVSWGIPNSAGGEKRAMAADIGVVVGLLISHMAEKRCRNFSSAFGSWKSSISRRFSI